MTTKKTTVKKQGERILFVLLENKYQFTIFKKEFSFGGKVESSGSAIEGEIIERSKDRMKIKAIIFPFSLWLKENEDFAIVEYFTGEKTK